MKYRYLGKSGLSVSRVCLGTATFGQNEWGCDASSAAAILNAYVAAGGNFIDTSDQYGSGRSESFIGNWLNGRNRDEIVLATKCFFPTGGDINARGLSRKHIVTACEASLRRLKSDFIDLYQVHEADPQTPLEETMSALDQLVRQGKVLYTGLSNFPAWQVMKAHAVAERGEMVRFTSAQYLYNLLKRDIEAEVVPACRECGIGILCWSPLSGGMLTGKYAGKDTPPPGTRLANRSDLATGRFKQWQEKSEAIVAELVRIAGRCNVEPAVIALAWLLKNEQVASVIIGATTPSQVTTNCAVGGWALSDEDERLLTALSQTQLPEPHGICARINAEWLQEHL